MKKQLLLFSSLLIVSAASAQITINMADIVVPPKTVLQANDTLPTVSVGSAGPSQTWNMSALNTHTIDSLSFMPTAWAPDAAVFPMSNMTLKQGNSGFFSYLSNTSAALDIIGNTGDLDPGTGTTEHLIQHVNPGERLISFPSTYNTNFVNDYGSIATFHYGVDPGIGFVVDSVMQRSKVHKVSVADAWGTITTPLGTFSALRLSQRKYTVDSTFGLISGFGWMFFQETIDSTKSYSWWTNGVGFPLVATDVDWTTNAPTRAQWLQATPTTGINEFTAAEINVFPNPATDHVSMQLDPTKVSTVLVYDLSGRLVEALAVQQDLLTINTANYGAGMYTYSLNSKDGNVLFHGKFTVNK